MRYRLSYGCLIGYAGFNYEKKETETVNYYLIGFFYH